jgi:hypothetical protein
VIRLCTRGRCKGGFGESQFAGTFAPPGLIGCVRDDPGLTPGANDARPLRGLFATPKTGVKDARPLRGRGGGEEEGIEASSHRAIEWEAKEEGAGKREPHGRANSTVAPKGKSKSPLPDGLLTVERTLDRGTRRRR